MAHVDGQRHILRTRMLWNYREGSEAETEFPGITLLRLSEKSRTSLQRSLTGHREGTFRPILDSVYRPNPRSERCSNHFSDSLFRQFVNRSNKPPPKLIANSASYLLTTL